jgi:transposase
LPGSRKELFETLDKLALKPLPVLPYAYATWKKAKVHIDYHIEFERHYYSVPYSHLSQCVEIRATVNLLEVFHKGQRIACHRRKAQAFGFSTLKEHMPAHHQAQLECSPAFLWEQARKIGPATVQFLEHLIASRPFAEQAYRACLGVLRLGKRYSEERLEKACARCDALGAYRYKHVESTLQKGLESQALPLESLSTARPIEHENVRGANYYQ